MKSTQNPVRRGRRARLLVGAGLTVLSLTLAACSGGGAGDGGGKITVFNRRSDPVGKPAAQAVFEGFTKATGIAVNNQVKPTSGASYQPAVRTAMSSSNPPTFATDISGPEVFNFAKAGVAKDMTKFYNETLKPRALAGATSSGVYKGKIYGISAGYSVGNLIWYNPVYLKKYGVDPSSIKTFHDMPYTQRRRASGERSVVVEVGCVGK